MEIIKDADALRKAIAMVGKSARKVNEQIHLCAVSALSHAFAYGDWTLAADLCQVLPNGQRVKALAHWFAHFSGGKLKLRKTSEGWRADVGTWKTRTKDDLNLDGAIQTMFGDLTAEKEPAVMTTEALVKLLARKAASPELDAQGRRKATRASIVLAATLERAAKDLLVTEEFKALLKEEAVEVETEKVLEAGSSSEAAAAIAAAA